MKPFIALALALVAVTALPAAADRLVIDDDGHWMVPDTPSTGRRIDIDDDGWRYLDDSAIRSNRNPSTPGVCTQLERSARVATADCGTMSMPDLVRRQAD